MTKVSPCDRLEAGAFERGLKTVCVKSVFLRMLEEMAASPDRRCQHFFSVQASPGRQYPVYLGQGGLPIRNVMKNSKVEHCIVLPVCAR